MKTNKQHTVVIVLSGGRLGLWSWQWLIPSMNKIQNDTIYLMLGKTILHLNVFQRIQYIIQWKNTCSLVPFHVTVTELELFRRIAARGRTPKTENIKVSLFGSSATTDTLILWFTVTFTWESCVTNRGG